MHTLLDRRRLIGGGLSVAGAATLAATLALTGPATAVRAQSTGLVYLVIAMSDSGNGQLPGGGVVTVTASVTNSLANTAIGDATPTVTVSYPAGTLSYSTNGAGWTCSLTTNAGQAVCTDGTITPGGGATLPIVFGVATDALVGDDAFITGTVTDGHADVNSGSFSGQTVATDSATVANGAAYTKDVPPGSYPSKVQQDQVVGTATQVNTFTFTDGGNTIRVVVPPNALQPGTHISVYRANGTYWNGSLSSSSQGFVDGYAAAWTGSDENTGSNAGGLVTLIVSDASVKSSDTLYRATTSGIGTRTGLVGNGAWTVSFSQDPGFVLAQAAAAPASSSSSAPSSSSSSPAGTTTVVAPAGGGGPVSTSGGTATLPIGIGVLLVVAGVTVIGSGRRRQDG